MWKKRSQTENASIQRNGEEGPSTGKETLTSPHKGNWKKCNIRCFRRPKRRIVPQNAHKISSFVFLEKKMEVPVVIFVLNFLNYY